MVLAENDSQTIFFIVAFSFFSKFALSSNKFILLELIQVIHFYKYMDVYNVIGQVLMLICGCQV